MTIPYIPSAPTRQSYGKREGFLTEDEEVRLARAWRDTGDVAARNRLVTAYHPLVMSIARRFTKTRSLQDDPDMLQHAYIGLLKAADGFDPERGFRFSTYAAWWVRAELQDYRMSNWSLVKRGRSAKARKAFFNLARIEETLIMGLRLKEGISLSGFYFRFGSSLFSFYGPEIAELTARGLLNIKAGRLRLTARGQLLANQVLAKFILT